MHWDKLEAWDDGDAVLWEADASSSYSKGIHRKDTPNEWKQSYDIWFVGSGSAISEISKPVPQLLLYHQQYLN